MGTLSGPPYRKGGVGGLRGRRQAVPMQRFDVGVFAAPRVLASVRYL